MLGRATLRIVLSSEMTSSATETTSNVHQRRSWVLWAVADMLAPPPRITIRDGVVSLLKHSRAIYATPTLRIYVALVTVALCGSGRGRHWQSARSCGPRYAPSRGHVSSMSQPQGSAARAGGRASRASSRRCSSSPTCGARTSGIESCAGRSARSRLDDSPLGQRRGVTGVQRRRHRRARAARAPRAHAPLPCHPPVGPVHDRRGGPDALLPPHRPPDPDAPPRATRCGCWARSCRRSAGASARVRPRGWALYFKGGWGSGTGWADHQVALLRRGSRRLAVAILITSSPSHAYGNETLRGMSTRLLRGLGPRSVPR